MDPHEFRIDENPRLEDREALSDALYAFNAAATGVDDGRWLSIFVRDGGGALEAGLHGWTWGGTGHVDNLWVREDLRGRGMGAGLLTAAEEEAARRGCREMQLSTHSYQAPAFYARQGYEAIGELPGWPGATTRVFFRKALSPTGPSPAADRL